MSGQVTADKGLGVSLTKCEVYSSFDFPAERQTEQCINNTSSFDTVFFFDDVAVELEFELEILDILNEIADTSGRYII